MNEKYQKGISIFIIMTIISMVSITILGVTAIMTSEMKISRNIGDSVIAFFVADTGIERSFYYDRKKIPQGANRGFCNICDSCLNCYECVTESTIVEEDGCNPLTCHGCKISFYDDTLNNRRYKISAETNQGDGLTKTIFKSYGDFRETTRAIELSITTINPPTPGIIIEETSVTPRSEKEGTTFEVKAKIYASGETEIDEESVIAYITNLNNFNELSINLSKMQDDFFEGSWTINEESSYNVIIKACDINENCFERSIFYL